MNLGRDPETGKRRQLYRSVRGTKSAAQAVLVDLLHERDVGYNFDTRQLTLAQYAQEWLRDYARPNTAATTFKRYTELWRRHILPQIGAVLLAQLRPEHIKKLKSRMFDKGLAPRTILQTQRVLREALHHAVREGSLARNPADAVKPPRVEKYQVPALNLAAIRRVLIAADQTDYGSLVHFAAKTGLRRGELMAVRWQDIDLDAAIVHVRQTCQWLVGEGFVFVPPKTHRSTRAVDLPPGIVLRLRDHLRRQLGTRMFLGPAYRDHDLVFASPTGDPVPPWSLRTVWKQIVQASDVGPLRFHDLRHAHATLMLIAGINPKIVSERLGHSSVAITMDTYSHVVPGLGAQAARKVELLLEGEVMQG